MNITEQTYKLSAWKRAPGRPTDGPPPHRSPMQQPGDPVQLWPLRHDKDAHPYAVRDWDGCEAQVWGLGAAQVTSGPMGETRMDYSGPVATNHDENSREAAASLEGEKIQTVRRTVYRAIRRLQPIACWQVEDALGMEHQTVSAAITWLHDNGHIYRDGKNKTPRNRSAHLYRTKK